VKKYNTLKTLRKDFPKLADSMDSGRQMCADRWKEDFESYLGGQVYVIENQEDLDLYLGGKQVDFFAEDTKNGVYEVVIYTNNTGGRIFFVSIYLDCSSINTDYR
jgi:hypothetical protein